jgi:hypothetical protein
MIAMNETVESSQDLGTEQVSPSPIRAGAEKALREKVPAQEKVDQLRFLSVDDLLILMHLSQSGLSVTEVAGKLKLTQPAVTQRIRKMEDAFGQKIIERKGRGIQLTHFGLEQAERATAALMALQGTTTVPSGEAQY